MNDQTQLLTEIRDALHKLVVQSERTQATYYDAVERQRQMEERMLARQKPLGILLVCCVFILGAAAALLLINRLGT